MRWQCLQKTTCSLEFPNNWFMVLCIARFMTTQLAAILSTSIHKLLSKTKPAYSLECIWTKFLVLGKTILLVCSTSPFESHKKKTFLWFALTEACWPSFLKGVLELKAWVACGVLVVWASLDLLKLGTRPIPEEEPTNQIRIKIHQTLHLHRWVSWLSIGLSRGRSWVWIRPDEHSGS